MPRTPSAIDRAEAEMPARAAAMLARLRADDKRRPFGGLDYTQYFPRGVETKADGKARFEERAGKQGAFAGSSAASDAAVTVGCSTKNAAEPDEAGAEGSIPSRSINLESEADAQARLHEMPEPPEKAQRRES
jgi:hypothetical protein